MVIEASAGAGVPSRTSIAAAPGAVVASLGIADIVTGKPRPCAFLGATGHVWWLAVDDRAVVVTDTGAVRLPNGLVAPDLLDAPAVGDVAVGGGSLRLGGVAWPVARWWDPRVAATRTTANEVMRRIDRVRIPAKGEGVAIALRERDAEAFVDEASALLGMGPGLTPTGDDLIAGMVAGFRYAATSIGDVEALRMLAATSGYLIDAARVRTTTLSSTLLRHAFDGEVPGPAAALLRAIGGRGRLDTAVVATLGIGHTSGESLAAGILSGTRAACEPTP